ncbi:MAG: hypothetical protein WBO10_08750 [Pyrinomonadaceae bacterium]
MSIRISYFVFVFIAVIVGGGAVASYAQDNPDPLISKPGDNRDDYPKSFREMMVKMRIDKEKKEYQQMLDRGEEVKKITEELEKAVARKGQLTRAEVNKVASVEKLVKKIRSELGGDDDDKKDEDQQKNRLSPVEAVKSLKAATLTLLDELKKTSRFSISAAAIESSNAVLRVARFLRLTN